VTMTALVISSAMKRTWPSARSSAEPVPMPPTGGGAGGAGGGGGGAGGGGGGPPRPAAPARAPRRRRRPPPPAPPPRGRPGPGAEDRVRGGGEVFRFGFLGVIDEPAPPAV